MSSDAPAALQPRVVIPFLLITLIWGSTWIVIRDQLGTVPATWSVTYRFAIACAAMFVYALAVRSPLAIGRHGHMLACLFGIPQFVLNFNFVYAAEHYVTSGLVAVVFALLLVPNTLLGWVVLKQGTTRAFAIGSAIAVVGVALLFVHEIRASPVGGGAVLLGIGLTLLGVLAASVSNVMQATERLRRYPVPSLLAWGMVYGVLGNAAVSLFLFGPPVIEYRWGYWLGLAYLGLFASAFAFTLYFSLIREIGPGKSAYTSLIVPVIAMGWSTLLEGYRWSTLAILGGLLAMAGLFVALRSGGKRSA